MVDESTQKVINYVYKIVGFIGLSMVEKVKLTVYQLKGVSEFLFEQLNGERAVYAGPLDTEKFRGAFDNRFFNL